MTAGPAQANSANLTPEQCNQNSNTFKAVFHFNSNNRGAWLKFGYSEENFGAFDGSTGFTIYHYCASGAGGGEVMKNNAASVTNRKAYGSGCKIRVHFNSYFKGVYDDILDDRGQNLVNTYNENASFQWMGSGC